MKEIKVRLRSVQEVRDFVAVATAQSFPIWVGDDSHLVNGKSFMELLCLDFSHPQPLSIGCEAPEREIFLRDAARFLYN